MAKILLIDDDPYCLELMTIRLKKEGHEVREVMDGEVGLGTANGWQPDLIFLDIRIPKIDGWEVCRQLKSQPKTIGIPIIMLTGCSQDAQEEYGRQCGADAYLVKPWEWPDLLKTIDKLLKARRSLNVLQSEDVRERIKKWIQEVVQQAGQFSKTESTRVMGEQLLRFATSAMAHYDELFRITPSTEFIQKSKQTCNDLEEVAYWLKLARDSKAVSSRTVDSLCKEAQTFIGLLKTK